MATTRPSGISIREARGLPAAPLDAARTFAEKHVPALRGHSFHVLFDPADHTHDGWRKAAIQELARENAPHRINAIVGTDDDAIGQAVDYLDQAPGITGQIFKLTE